MLISLKNACFSYGDITILKNISAAIDEDSRIGLIGTNGAGKTTLLNLIAKILSPSFGEVFHKNGLSIGFLKQNSGLSSENTVYGEMQEVFSDIYGIERRLRETEAELARTHKDSEAYRRTESEYARLTAYYEAKDGYSTEIRIKTVLNGMGFADFYNNIINTMSGGEKTRLAIAKLLLKAPDLLILDEPTNHLDFETLSWLEEYLSSYKGALLIVSHDRYFLDRTVNRIFELSFSAMESYRGNYSRYKTLKEESFLYKMREYLKQQEEIAKLEDYIAKNGARASTAKSAKSRENKLENMELLEKPRLDDKRPHFKFDCDIEPVKIVLSVSNLELSAGGKQLFKELSFTLGRGEKLAIVGANGTGKSTLIKHLLGLHLATDSNVVWGGNVTLSYYDQENLNLNFNNTVLDEIWGTFRGYSQTEIRKTLAAVGLTEEDIGKQIGMLSGGERAKLGFAMMTAKRANTMLLDEPTNHLDLAAREELESALKDFTGTLIFVSHDRYFLSSVATCVLEIENKGGTFYNCGFEEYQRLKRENKRAAAAKQEAAPIILKAEKTEGSYRSAKQRGIEAAAKGKISEAEKAIAALEARETEIYAEMANNTDHKQIAKLSVELEENKRESERLYELLFELTGN